MEDLISDVLNKIIDYVTHEPARNQCETLFVSTRFYKHTIQYIKANYRNHIVSHDHLLRYFADDTELYLRNNPYITDNGLIVMTLLTNLLLSDNRSISDPALVH